MTDGTIIKGDEPVCACEHTRGEHGLMTSACKVCMCPKFDERTPITSRQPFPPMPAADVATIKQGTAALVRMTGEAFSGGDWVIDRGFRDVMFGGDHSTSEDDFLSVYPDFDPVAVLDPNDQAPADVVEVHGPHQEANARLIAGAGDLFHSVVALRDFLVAAYDGPGATELIERADAAITAVREGRKS